MWLMKIDKMDQAKTIVPAVWQQRKSPFFKNGNRLVVGIQGSECRS
jgi:hypothetical protein